MKNTPPHRYVAINDVIPLNMSVSLVAINEENFPYLDFDKNVFEIYCYYISLHNLAGYWIFSIFCINRHLMMIASIFFSIIIPECNFLFLLLLVCRASLGKFNLIALTIRATSSFCARKNARHILIITIY